MDDNQSSQDTREAFEADRAFLESVREFWTDRWNDLRCVHPIQQPQKVQA